MSDKLEHSLQQRLMMRVTDHNGLVSGTVIPSGNTPEDAFVGNTPAVLVREAHTSVRKQFQTRKS